ncbi:MAG: aldehyde dehydrogenase, partial [Bacteroidia bacterium]|nr:aldehyde dehydrogenase [Bacteroidia bacterium]
AEVYAQIPDSSGEDVDNAGRAAHDAFKTWSVTPAGERSRIILNIAAGIEKRMDELVKAETDDNGKPLWLSKETDIPRAASNFHFYATAIEHFASEAHPMEDKAINYTLRQPIGVCACISPWNLPLYLFTWKVAPALAAGNTVVAKPSELTPVTASMLGEICKEAGLPKGVLNILHGFGHTAGAAMTSHPQVKVISFTGGTKTGETIAASVATQFKKLSLEMGGKNPNIIFDDSNLKRAISTSVHSSFRNQGEICLCGSRIFIQKGVYEEFKKGLVEKVSKLKTGDPYEEDNFVGAMVSKNHYEKVLSYIKLAQEEGGKILSGGKAVKPEGRCANGYFIEPTIIEGLPHDCRTNQEEIFGPVVTLQPFDTEEEVIEYANSTKYGLASSVWTENLSRAHRVAGKLHAGIVWINCWMMRDLRTPFGGVKNSGVGREGGFEALKFFTEEKNVCVKI